MVSRRDESRELLSVVDDSRETNPIWDVGSFFSVTNTFHFGTSLLVLETRKESSMMPPNPTAPGNGATALLLQIQYLRLAVPEHYCSSLRERSEPN
jgi:hypothetical protein